MYQTQQSLEKTITRNQSTSLVKNLVRTAISSIAYVRNLFPQHCFEERYLSGVNIQTLLPQSAESKLLINWLEHGVFDALDKNYLSDLVFAIYSPGEPTPTLVECYQFHIDYSENDGCSLSLHHSSGTASSIEHTRASIKDATVRLIRTLVMFTQTLDQLPDERYITIKLQYRDDITPPDYEPQHFRAGEVGDDLVFEQRPYKTSIGAVHTQFHHVNLKLKTTKDMIRGDTSPAAQTQDAAVLSPLLSSLQASLRVSQAADDGAGADVGADEHGEAADEDIDANANHGPTLGGYTQLLKNTCATPVSEHVTDVAQWRAAERHMRRVHTHDTQWRVRRGALLPATQVSSPIPDYLALCVEKGCSAQLVPADMQPVDCGGRPGAPMQAVTCLFNVVAHFVCTTGVTSQAALRQAFPALTVPATRRMLHAMTASGILTRTTDATDRAVDVATRPPYGTTLTEAPVSRGHARASTEEALANTPTSSALVATVSASMPSGAHAHRRACVRPAPQRKLEDKLAPVLSTGMSVLRRTQYLLQRQREHQQHEPPQPTQSTQQSRKRSSREFPSSREKRVRAQ